jgi:serine/threonine protein kinase
MYFAEGILSFGKLIFLTVEYVKIFVKMSTTVPDFIPPHPLPHSASDGPLPDSFVGNYRVERTIGSGTYGKVKLGVHVHTEEKVIPPPFYIIYFFKYTHG